MTYARARLWLGISGVGFWVIISAAILGLNQPAIGSGGLTSGVLLVGAYIGLSLPFDYLGGFFLPRRFGRPTPSLATFILCWCRGVILHGLLLVATGIGLLAAASVAGLAGVVAAAGLIMLALLIFQGELARLVGGLTRLNGLESNLAPAREIMKKWGVAVPRLEVVRVTDPAFSGGWVGLPGVAGMERLVIPANWVAGVAGSSAGLPGLTSEELAIQLTRRVGVLRGGRRWRGVALALGWNLCGVALASLASGLAETGADAVTGAAWLLARFAAAFTLWSFVGLLVLPSFSRPGVFAADRFAIEHGATRERLIATAAIIDRGQDDEPARPGGIETIFHPLPSIANRVAALDAPPAASGAWQAARVALFTSWGGLGLLGRAVHCNSGRPELWVLLPAD